MTKLERYERTRASFSKINDAIWPLLERLPEDDAKPGHRANDTALILFSIFAFEALCWDCIHEVEDARQDCGIRLIPALEKAAYLCGTLAELPSELSKLRPIMKIRDLYAHAAGRRRGLDDRSSLTPATLRAHLFETDNCQGCPDQHACDACTRTDFDTEWWPTRSLCGDPGFFSIIGAKLKRLAPLLVEKLKIA